MLRNSKYAFLFPFSILIKSDLKWCVHLSRSLFLYIHTKVKEEWQWRNWICTSAAELTPFNQRPLQMEKRLQTLSYVEKDMAAPCQKKGLWHLWPALGWAPSDGSFDLSRNFSTWILSTYIRWNTCKCQRKNLEAAHLVQEAPGRSQAGSNSSSSSSWHHVLWHAVWVEGVWKHSVWCVYGDVSGHMWRVCRWSYDQDG